MPRIDACLDSCFSASIDGPPDDGHDEDDGDGEQPSAATGRVFNGLCAPGFKYSHPLSTSRANFTTPSSLASPCSLLTIKMLKESGNPSKNTNSANITIIHDEFTRAAKVVDLCHDGQGAIA